MMHRPAAFSLAALVALTISATADADNIGPMLTITAPASGALVHGTVPISADASDPDGVFRLNFYVDGVSIGADYTAPYSVDWATTAVADGTHQIKVIAFDADPARNKTTQTLNVTVDNTPPAAPVITSAPSSPGTDTAPSWSFTGETGVSFECQLTPLATWSSCTSPKSYDLSGQSSATYTFSVRAIDAAGNLGAAATSDYQFDNGLLFAGYPFCSYDSQYAGVAECPSTGPWSKTFCVAGVGYDSIQTDTGRFEVHQGDQGAVGGGDRCELAETDPAVTGSHDNGAVRFFAFDTTYGSSVLDVDNTAYQTFGQWHRGQASLGTCGGTGTPIKVAVTGPVGAKRLEVHTVQCSNGVLDSRIVRFSTPLTTDNLHHRWLLEIKWSPDPAVGYVRITHDGTLVVPSGCEPDGRCMMATRESTTTGTLGTYAFKVGVYRDKDITFPTSATYSNVKVGLTAASVGY